MALRMLSRPAPDWRETIFLTPTSAAETYRRRACEVLIPPQAQRELNPDRLLLIIPSGMLYHLPFGALQNGAGFLAQQAMVCLAPSLQTVSLLHARSISLLPPALQGKLLAVAVDTFGGDFPDLPWVANEVTALSRLWSGEIQVLQNEQATPTAIRQLSESGSLLDYRVIHFATHAIYDGESGRLSRLLLRDGCLFVDDIRTLRLAARLIVLSACQTGLGQTFSGDEVLGLAYSFLAAGVQTVIASLWHINDPGTKSLMERFYHALGQDTCPTRALTWAQRSAIAEGWPPYFWASFSPMGLP